MMTKLPKWRVSSGANISPPTLRLKTRPSLNISIVTCATTSARPPSPCEYSNSKFKNSPLLKRKLTGSFRAFVAMIAEKSPNKTALMSDKAQYYADLSGKSLNLELLEYQAMIGAVGQMRPEACPCCEGVEMLQGHDWVQRVWVDIWIHRL